MTTYHCYATIVSSQYLGEIEAKSAEEAKDKAFDNAHVSFCYECERRCEGPEITEIFVEERP